MNNEITLSYSNFKAIATQKAFDWQVVESDSSYQIWGYDGSDCYSTYIYRVDPHVPGLDFTVEQANATDFEANYKADTNKPITPIVVTQPNNNFMLQGDAVMSEVPAGATGHNVDLPVGGAGGPSFWLGGCEYWAHGAAVGDWCEFQIVDKDDLLGYGAGTVLKQYVFRRYIPDNVVRTIKSEAPGEIPGGLYLRVVYHSVGTTNPKFLINYDLNSKD
jgi:hypothetical protein